MDNEHNPPPIEDIESDSISENDTAPSSDSAAQIEQATSVLEDQTTSQSEKVEKEPASESDSTTHLDLATQIDQVIATPPLNQEPLQRENVEDKAISETGLENCSDSALLFEQASITPPNRESPQTGNIDDDVTPKKGPEIHADSILHIDRAPVGPLSEELLQPGNVEDSASSETGAETHTESPLPRITAPPDQVLPQKGEETSSIQESASETFTGPKLVTEQVTTDPLAQERPDPPLRSIDKRSRLENSLSVVSVIVAILTLMAIAIQAWIYDQQRTIMSTQVENTQKNIQITERAYIGVASLKADLDHGEVVVMLENIGRKPAKAITMKADAYHINAVKLKKGAKTNFNSGEVRLFPGSFKMRVVVPLPECDPQEIRAISENRQFLYVDGIIQYDDGFGFTDSTTFAFKYIPPPREGWEAVDTPLAHLEEKLTSEVFKLSQDGDITIVSPAFDRSRRLSPPAYIPSPSVPSPSGSSPPGQSPSVPSPPGPTALGPSPLASATKTSTPALTNERDTGCKCTCRQTCGGCTYTCTGCGLVEAAELSARCCENAISPPCPDDPK